MANTALRAEKMILAQLLSKTRNMKILYGISTEVQIPGCIP